MIYYALAVITATTVTVADVYTTREPCLRDAHEFRQILGVADHSVRCVPTTENNAEQAEQQLINIEIFMKPTK